MEVGRGQENDNSSLVFSSVYRTFTSIANIYVNKDATGGCSPGTRADMRMLGQSTGCHWRHIPPQVSMHRTVNTYTQHI